MSKITITTVICHSPVQRHNVIEKLTKHGYTNPYSTMTFDVAPHINVYHRDKTYQTIISNGLKRQRTVFEREITADQFLQEPPEQATLDLK